jgi:protein transport protein SEC13
MIHDAQMDYYGKRLATCSSDRTIKIFNVQKNVQTHVTDLLGHEGPVWQVSWAHPKFGNYLASSSYDRRVLIWKEVNKNEWKTVYEYKHELSVNSVCWAPHEFGLSLACASTDTTISIHTNKGNDNFSEEKFIAHTYGVNAVSWSPVTSPVKRLASGGCDNSVKIWRFSENKSQWEREDQLDFHTDWVRDVAWAPNIGLPSTTIASCSQDGSVIIWSQEEPNARFTSKVIKQKGPEVVWRVSWSITGNILAVSGGDNQVTLWKESLEGEWKPIYSMDETGQIKAQ